MTLYRSPWCCPYPSHPDGILILDADTGQITDVNHCLVKMLGDSHAELLGRQFLEIGPFKDIAAARAAFSELQSSGYIRYEDLPLEASDGRSLHVEFVSNVYWVDQQRVIQCNIRDISARQRAEAALSQSIAELQVRNEELDAVAHTVAHNLKNPVHLIVNYPHQVMPILDCLSLVHNNKEYLRDDTKRDARVDELSTPDRPKPQEDFPGTVWACTHTRRMESLTHCDTSRD